MEILAAITTLRDADPAYDLEQLVELAEGGRAARDVVGNHVDDDGDMAADEVAALNALSIPIEMCQCAGCDCTRPATTTDDGGVAVCQGCSSYMTTDDGDVICARMGLGETCHVCGATIEWESIRTGNPGSGSSNYRRGKCKCGDTAWMDADKGGWGNYSYSTDER